MIGRVALLVTFKKAKPKPQSLSRSHIRDLPAIALPLHSLLRYFNHRILGLHSIIDHSVDKRD